MGNGLFARKPIPRGTRILIESPLIAIPSGHSGNAEISAFCKALQSLSDADRKTFDSLHCSTESITAGRRTKILQWCREFHISYAGQKPLNAAWIQDVAEVTTKRYAIFNTNKMAMARAFDGAGGVAVYPLFSRANHSCVPNAQNIYNASLQRLTVYAIRDIQAEEQVFVAYFKTAFQTLQQRRQIMKAWGFVCSYVLCTDPSVDLETQRMLELEQKLAAYDGTSPSTRIEAGAGLEASAVPRDATDALRAAEELVALLKKQGLVGWDLRNT